MTAPNHAPSPANLEQAKYIKRLRVRAWIGLLMPGVALLFADSSKPFFWLAVPFCLIALVVNAVMVLRCLK